MQRRDFLRGVLAATAASALRLAPAGAGQPAAGPYGPLQAPDVNGIRLPAGFTAREVARAGEPVPGTSTRWHRFPDGGATFATRDGGWVYVSNSEVALVGGASALRFAASGDLAGARRILRGTTANCAGGPTPWGTWLSCEEHRGRVWECDPLGEREAEPRPAMGVFVHEAAGAARPAAASTSPRTIPRAASTASHPSGGATSPRASSKPRPSARTAPSAGSRCRTPRPVPPPRASSSRSPPRSTGARACGSPRTRCGSPPRATTGSGRTTWRTIACPSSTTGAPGATRPSAASTTSRPTRPATSSWPRTAGTWSWSCSPPRATSCPSCASKASRARSWRDRLSTRPAPASTSARSGASAAA
jgi:hypothetical protein